MAQPADVGNGDAHRTQAGRIQVGNAGAAVAAWALVVRRRGARLPARDVPDAGSAASGGRTTG
ncbi:hypothetical protein [Streptomyces sp. 769]|uniref:hypothetical protein n=1 Tax=Streptomyces sp. 769 TaxID=1262452 RepID=UPI00131C1F5A|nr:hypothetical protein [Streptomyces sp. 769]